MLNGDRVIAVIPARGGSKSVPGKNIRILAGKPLLVWSIDVARQVEQIDRIIVSTDDPQIASMASEHGAEVYDRPPHLATDTSLVIDALKHLVATLKAERETAKWLVLLEPTCPLRRSEDVRDCLRVIAEDGCDSAATFMEAELNPHRAWRVVDGRPKVFIDGAIPWLPRQKQPESYQLNGAVYICRIDLLASQAQSLLLGKAGAVIMPKSRSHDIDDPVDFAIAEALLRSLPS